MNFYIIFDYGMKYLTSNIIGKGFARGLNTLRVHHQRMSGGKMDSSS